MSELLHTVLEGVGVVGPVHPGGGSVVDLPLRARVFAVRGDDVDAEAGHLVHDPLDQGHPGVSDCVEDVVAAEEWRLCLSVEDEELRLDADQRLVAELVTTIEHPAKDMARSRFERPTIVPVGVADHPAGCLDPRDDAGGRRIRPQTLVGVGDLLVVEGA